MDSLNHKQYKYYKFTLPDDKHAKEIIFDMTTLHGDADIYISKTNKQPNSDDKEWSSQRVGGVADHISLNSSDTKLSGTFYVSIYGYAFSTYQLIARVKRDNDHDVKGYPLLLEGFAMKGNCRGSSDIKIYQFDVLMSEEKDINV